MLLLGDTVMIPDFALTHKRLGHRVLIELVGFWHPDYLRRKVEKVRAAHCHHVLLLVYEGVNLAAERLRDVPGEVVYFRQKPLLKEVMGAVDALAERVYGGRQSNEGMLKPVVSVPHDRERGPHGPIGSILPP